MVDVSQNLTGTITGTKVPELNPIATVSLSHGNVVDSAALGTAAPVNPVSSVDRPAIEVNSAATEVLDSMKNLPPPVDIEAVDRIRESISLNDYPIDLDKVAQTLAAAFDVLR
ncbi:putative flgM-like regulatory protein [Octadecabacter antarcticus 307]|uniref:Putative flgM-like regulatory protein n=1 Tax=Octadecabacter antarcticus 307 TaxID=391626 RepID=M9R8H9_9RHOB|nr:flgM-like regulatory protein [Octadecabacter antarcticus]AGI68522.1 putative flgM-like regulatory protein [Octadecabacter antarcticus 307]